jgi:hypothetical protein
MRLFKLADLLALKYKTAAATDEEKVESDIRRSVLDLWNLSNNKTYDILRVIGDSVLKDAPNSERERNAKRGHSFVVKVLSVIDQLKIGLNTVPLQDIESSLKAVINLIEEESEDGGRGTVDFPDLTDFITLMGKNNRNHNQSDKRHVDTQYGKIRTVLTRIHSLADAIVTKLQKARGEPMAEKNYRHHQRGRLVPRRSPLYKGDIVDFLRQYGPQYGLNSTDDWQRAFENDPPFKEQITTVVNALNRAKTPRDETTVKMQIAEIMRAHELRVSNNLGALEAPELPKPAYISPELKEERMMAQREQAEAAAEAERRLQEQVRQRDEANKRHQLENQPSEEELKDKYSSLRIKQILKRYQ